MRRRGWIWAALVLLAAGILGSAIWWQGRLAASRRLPEHVDIAGQLGVREQQVSGRGTYSLVYVREHSPVALMGDLLMQVAQRPFSLNESTQSLYLLDFDGVPENTGLILLADSMALDYLLDAQVAVGRRDHAEITLRPVSIPGRFVTGTEAGKVRDMVENGLRLQGRVTVDKLPEGRVRVTFGKEQRALAPGERWTISRELTAGGETGISELYIVNLGQWPLSNITYLRKEE